MASEDCFVFQRKTGGVDHVLNQLLLFCDQGTRYPYTGAKNHLFIEHHERGECSSVAPLDNVSNAEDFHGKWAESTVRFEFEMHQP